MIVLLRNFLKELEALEICVLIWFNKEKYMRKTVVHRGPKTAISYIDFEKDKRILRAVYSQLLMSKPIVRSNGEFYNDYCCSHQNCCVHRK